MNKLQAEQAFAAANQHLSRGELTKASQLYQDILAHFPRHIAARLNLGTAYFNQNQIDQAIAQFKAAQKIDPNHPAALHCLGQLYFSQKKYHQALSMLQTAHQLDPRHPAIIADLYHLAQLTADWSLQRQLSNKLTPLAAKSFTESPFINLLRVKDPHQNLQAAINYCQPFMRVANSLAANHPPIYPNKLVHNQLKIGYISYDFRSHPIGTHLQYVIPNHSPNFKTHIYMYGPDDHSQTFQTIQKNASVFHHLYQQSLNLIYQAIADDQLHILIDTTGWTAHHRSAVCLAKPAPLLVNFLGFPGSMGHPNYDYLIADEVLIPNQMRRYYSEAIAYLPHTYLPYLPHQPKPSPRPPSLPDNYFIFASFSQPYKITPTIFAAWMDILKAVPHSVLWLSTPPPLAQKNLRHQASQSGIGPQRLVFAPPLPLRQHLQRLHHVNLILDTPDYTGGSSTSLALSQHIPVLTISGNRYVERMSTSMLIHLGLDALCVSSLSEYTKTAIALAQSPDALKHIQTTLAHNFSHIPSADPKQYTQSLERLYIAMWKNYLKNPTRQKDPIYLT